MKTQMWSYSGSRFVRSAFFANPNIQVMLIFPLDCSSLIQLLFKSSVLLTVLAMMLNSTGNGHDNPPERPASMSFSVCLGYSRRLILPTWPNYHPSVIRPASLPRSTMSVSRSSPLSCKQLVSTKYDRSWLCSVDSATPSHTK